MLLLLSLFHLRLSKVHSVLAVCGPRELHQALVSLGLVLRMFVSFIICCLGFCVGHLVVVIFVLLVPAK